MNTQLLATAVAVAALAACRGTSRQSARPLAVAYCTSNSAAARDVPASLAVTLGFDRDPSKGALATIQIEGETTRINQPVATNQIARYELARGMYDIRVAVDGYETLRARIVLSPGCTMELPIAMRLRSVK